MIFRETFFENNQPSGPLLCVRLAGRTQSDPDYAIQRSDSPTEVLGCVLSGTLYMEENAEPARPLTAGMSYLLPHHACYRIFSDPRDPASTLWLNLRGCLLSDMTDRLFAGRCTIGGNSIQKKLRAVISMLPDSQDRMPDIARAVFDMLLDIYSSPLLPDPLPHQAHPDSAYDAYISHHLQGQFSVQEMADAFHVSADILNRSCRKALGTTPYRYYQQMRIALACSLLSNTRLTMDQIAERLNFTDRNYFSYYFKKCTGISPVRFRKSGTDPKRSRGAAAPAHTGPETLSPYTAEDPSVQK